MLFAAVGLALLPRPNPLRQRLAWLAEHRFDQLAVAAGEAAPGGARRWIRRRTQWATRQAGLWSLVTVGALWLPLGPVPSVLAGLSVRATWAGLRMVAAERDGDRALAEAAAAVAAVHDEYRAGATTGLALLAAAAGSGRYRSALSRAGGLAVQGEDPEPALAVQPALATLAVACALAGRVGAPLVEVLNGVRADLAADRATRRAVQAAVAGPRTSALLLAGLPVVGVVMGVGIGAHPTTVLLHTTLGLVALTVGVTLEFIGVGWILRLTRQPET